MEQRRLTHWELFSGFFEAGILGFGGVLPVARRMIVEGRGWMTQAEFNDLFSLCQFMPGANVVNLTFAIGARNRGVTGVAAAVTGLLAAPVCIVMGFGAAYMHYAYVPAVRHAIAGLAAAAAGLVIGTALRIAVPIFTSLSNVLIALAVLGLVALLHRSLPITILAVLPLSLLLSWRRLR
jgi:chromate transporter